MPESRQNEASLRNFRPDWLAFIERDVDHALNGYLDGMTGSSAPEPGAQLVALNQRDLLPIPEHPEAYAELLNGFLRGGQAPRAA